MTRLSLTLTVNLVRMTQCVCVSISIAEKFVEFMYVFILSLHECMLKVNEGIIVKLRCYAIYTVGNIVYIVS